MTKDVLLRRLRQARRQAFSGASQPEPAVAPAPSVSIGEAAPRAADPSLESEK